VIDLVVLRENLHSFPLHPFITFPTARTAPQRFRTQRDILVLIYFLDLDSVDVADEESTIHRAVIS
jgi:hypothetical protein